MTAVDKIGQVDSSRPSVSRYKIERGPNLLHCRNGAWFLQSVVLHFLQRGLGNSVDSPPWSSYRPAIST